MGFFSTKQSGDLVAGIKQLDVNDTNSTSPEAETALRTEWKPDFFRPWPFKEGEDLPSMPWARPEQLPMSFVGVNLIDVESSKVTTVKIERGEIVSITKAKLVDMQESGYTSIDCDGLYMCPGLIDCHQLVRIGPNVSVQRDNADMQMDLDTDDNIIAFNCRAFLSNGFTTIRDVGGAYRRHRRATEEWLIPGPRLLVGGPVLSQTGGHGDQGDRDGAPIFHGGIERPQYNALSLVIDGVDACLKTARKLMSAEVDHIKICSSGGVLSQYDKLDSAQFTVPEIKAICDTVDMMGGTLVTSHCNTDRGARNAIEAGIGGIEHGGLLQEDTLRLMAKKGVHFTPTLTVQELIVNGPLGKKISPYSLSKAKIVAESSYRAIKKAHELGVNIAYGTDCPVQVQLAEFELRAKVLPGKEVLKHATCNAAKVIKMEGKVGCVREGAFADVLLLDANPLDDIAVMGRPDKYLKAVVKDGRCVRSAVDGLRVEVNLY